MSDVATTDTPYNPQEEIDELLGAQPEAPPKRQWGTQTGAEFFTEANRGLYQDLIGTYTTGVAAGDLDAFYGGLSGTYGDIAVVSGYREWDEATETWGEFTPTESLFNTASKMAELNALKQPETFEEWLISSGQSSNWTPDITSSEPYLGVPILDEDGNPTGEYVPGTGIQGIVGLNADLDDEDAEGNRLAAIDQGFVARDSAGNVILDAEGNETADMAAYWDWKAEGRAELDAGMLAQPGLLGTQYEKEFRRNVASSIYQTVTQNQRMIESLGTQSSVAAYSKMAETSDLISDATIQAEFKLMEQDLLWREAEYEALERRWDAAGRQTLAVKSQHMEEIRLSRGQALEAYAIQLTALVEQNAQIIEMRDSDVRAISVHADMVFNQLMATIEYEGTVDEQLTREAEQYMQPWRDALEVWAIEMGIAQAALDSEIAQDQLDIDQGILELTLAESGMEQVQSVDAEGNPIPGEFELQPTAARVTEEAEERRQQESDEFIGAAMMVLSSTVVGFGIGTQIPVIGNILGGVLGFFVGLVGVGALLATGGEY